MPERIKVFLSAFLTTEWQQVVDGWQLDSWEEYRDVNRLGRKTKTPRRAAEAPVWSIFEGAFAPGLRGQGLITTAGMFNVLARYYASGAAPPFDFAVVDEDTGHRDYAGSFRRQHGCRTTEQFVLCGRFGTAYLSATVLVEGGAGPDVRGRSTTLKN